MYCGDDAQATMSLPFLLIAMMSKMKDQIIFKSEFDQPQLTDMLYDMMNSSIFQFSLFLSYHSNNNYAQLIPEDSWSLLMELKVAPEVAYKIMRPSFKTLHKMEEKEWQESVVKMKSTFDDFSVDHMYLCPRGSEGQPDLITDAVKEIRSRIWEQITPELYCLFWILEPENLFVPTDAYSTQIEKLQDSAKTDSKSKPDKNTEKLKKNIEILKQEQSSQQKEKEKLDVFLMAKKVILTDQFFEAKNNVAFAQFCCLPRLRLSPADAIYCVKFLNCLINIKGLPFLEQLEFRFGILQILFPSTQCCSKEEATNLGVFFKELLAVADLLNDNHKLYHVALISRRSSRAGRSTTRATSRRSTRSRWCSS